MACVTPGESHPGAPPALAATRFEPSLDRSRLCEAIAVRRQRRAEREADLVAACESAVAHGTGRDIHVRDRAIRGRVKPLPRHYEAARRFRATAKRCNACLTDCETNHARIAKRRHGKPTAFRSLNLPTASWAMIPDDTGGKAEVTIEVWENETL
jgi:hypothetical protein